MPPPYGVRMIREAVAKASAAMVAEINRLRKANESLGGSFEVIDGVGHWPQFEKPAEHDEILTRFLLSQE